MLITACHNSHKDSQRSLTYKALLRNKSARTFLVLGETEKVKRKSKEKGGNEKKREEGGESKREGTVLKAFSKVSSLKRGKNRVTV